MKAPKEPPISNSKILVEYLKNHSKLYKNHKIENQILLDSTLLDLCSEYIISYILVQMFSVDLDIYFSVMNS